MLANYLWRALLIAIAALLAAHVLHEFSTPRPAYAQAYSPVTPVYIEPGVKMLRAPDGSKQLLGKVVVDLSNGNIWGFPTYVEQPYPVDVMKSDPPVSKPFLLGKFDFSRMVTN